MKHPFDGRLPGRLLLILALVLLLAGCGGEGGDGDASGSDSTAVGEAGAGDTSGEDAAEAAGDEEEEEEAPKERATSVDAARVAVGDLVVPVVAEGSVRARRSAELKAEIAGRLDKVVVEEGQAVSRGQLLVQIDDREIRVALEEANSRYLEALGKLAADDETLDSKTATIQLAEELEKLDKLYDEGAITLTEKQERQIALEVEAVKEGAYRGELVKIRSGLADARAAKQRAELDLERTRVRAPFRGVVSDLELTPGERVTIGEKICQLVDLRNLEADVAVLESDLRGLEAGKPVRLELPALGKEITGRVDVMSPEIDPESRTCRVLVRFENPEGNIRPGMFVRAAIAGDVYPETVMVPREAILTRDGRPLVFRVEGDRAKWVYVELGRMNDTMVGIDKVLQGGPLDDGTLVVVSNHLTLTHDAKVKVRKVVEPALAWFAEPQEDDE